MKFREDERKHIVEILERAAGEPFGKRIDDGRAPAKTPAVAAITKRRNSNTLIRERAAEVIEPSPFFQTRVLAALRDQANNNVPAFWRLWKSTGALVSSMAATTAALAVLSFMVPGSSTPTSQEATAALVPYSAEAVVLDQMRVRIK